jgi:hypothetical protein
MHRRIISTLYFMLMLSGCAMNPQQQAALLAQANRPVTCQKGDDCDAKWSLATQWVQQHCAYKFQTISENVIQTMGPLHDDPRPAYTITKVSDGKGVYTFAFDGGCDNIFGCVPSLLEAKASFVTYVIGPVH